jgi:hypothetical protein
MQVNHEWLAEVAGLLPDAFYLRAIRWWRIGAGADPHFSGQRSEGPPSAARP